MDKELLLKYIAGKASQKEKEDVATWIDADAANLKEFISLRKSYDAFIWQDTDAFSKKTKKTISLHPVTQRILRIAAVFVVAFGLSYAMIQVLQKEDIEMQTVYVPAGQRTLVTLADGTTVWVNGKSTLTFPNCFSSRTRKVELDGEAYFDVARNEKCPFIVHTHAMDIEVLGTKFNVEAYAKQQNFEASLIQGKIKIKSPSDNNISQVLLPDYKSTLKNGKLVISKIEDYNIYRWKEGLYCFKNKSFIEIIKDLEKYYNLKIIVDKPSITNIILTGKFRISDGLDYALRILQKDVPFIYDKHTTDDIIYIK
mgnify:CR=1 FL=1